MGSECLCVLTRVRALEIVAVALGSALRFLSPPPSSTDRRGTVLPSGNCGPGAREGRQRDSWGWGTWSATCGSLASFAP